LLYCV